AFAGGRLFAVEPAQLGAHVGELGLELALLDVELLHALGRPAGTGERLLGAALQLGALLQQLQLGGAKMTDALRGHSRCAPLVVAAAILSGGGKSQPATIESLDGLVDRARRRRRALAGNAVGAAALAARSTPRRQRRRGSRSARARRAIAPRADAARRAARRP